MKELHGAPPVRTGKPPSIPRKMWEQAGTIAHFFPNPKDFRERMLALGEQYGVSERHMEEVGMIEKQTPKPTVSSLSEKILTEVRRGEYDRLTPGVTEAEIVTGVRHKEPFPAGMTDQQISDRYTEQKICEETGKSWNEPKEQQNPFDNEKRDPDPKPQVPRKTKE